MEGLQKVLKTMSNEMVEIKKQVAETSTKKPFRNSEETKLNLNLLMQSLMQNQKKRKKKKIHL